MDNQFVTTSPSTTDLQGTNIASQIVPFKSTDTYATHLEQYGCGGYRSVSSIAERNSIPVLRRKLGMLVNVIGVGVFKLISNPVTDATTTDNWASFNATGVTDLTPATNGNLITLSDSNLNRTVVTDDLPTYVFNVFLKASTQYQKFTWCLVLKDIIPSLNFITANATGTNSPAELLLGDANDLNLSKNTSKIFEFETWDGGNTWFISTKVFNAKSTDTPREVITRGTMNSALAWENA